MSTASNNPFTSFVNTYCGLVANQVSDMSSRFDTIVTQSNALFDELAIRGEAVEAEIKKSIPGNMNMNKSIKDWFDAFSFGSAKRDKQIGLSANLSNQRNANGDILMSKDKHHGDKLRAY